MAMTPRPSPQRPDDSFKGAEASAELQKRNALAVVAEYGRRGLEAVVRNGADLTSRVQATNTAYRAMADDFNIPDAMRAELAGQIRKTFTPAVENVQWADRNVRSENAAASQAAGTYFDQVRQAVPMYRSENDELTETYRQAYEERQAKIRAEAEERAEQRRQFELGLQAQVEARNLAARQHAATMAAQQQMHAASMSSSARMAAAQLAAIRAQAPMTAPPPSPYQLKKASGAYSDPRRRQGIGGAWRR